MFRLIGWFIRETIMMLIAFYLFLHFFKVLA